MAKHPKRKPRSREKQRGHLAGTLSSLVTLAEAAAELHIAASVTACAISELLAELQAVEESKPRLLKVQ